MQNDPPPPSAKSFGSQETRPIILLSFVIFLVKNGRAKFRKIRTGNGNLNLPNPSRRLRHDLARGGGGVVLQVLSHPVGGSALRRSHFEWSREAYINIYIYTYIYVYPYTSL